LAIYKKGSNVGVRLGKVSKVDGGFLAVIDCDSKSNDAEHQKELKDKVEELFPGLFQKAPLVESGRGNGSCHLYVKTNAPATTKRLSQSPKSVRVHMPSSPPSRRELKELSKKEIELGWRIRPAWEISLMGEGSQVVLPPSIHPDSKKAYTWKRSVLETEIPLIEVSVSSTQSVEKERSETDMGDFKPEYVDLLSSELSSHVVDMILSGKNVEDRSAALFTVTAAMLKARFSKHQILSVLTDRNTFLGETAFDHAKTENRKRAAEWLEKYTLRKVEDRISAEKDFEGEVETRKLEGEDVAAQEKELLVEKDWRERLERTAVKNGNKPKNTLRNVKLILVGMAGNTCFRKDEFAGLEIYGCDTPWGGKKGEELRDIDTICIKDWLSSYFRFEPSNDRINEAISKIASENKFHPVRDYLDTLEWDCTPRIDSWLKTYLHAEAPEPYLSAVSRKILCAMIARVYNPGVKFDQVLILEGSQGIGKSTAIRNLTGEIWFSDSHINISDKDSVLSMRSIWVIELGELSGMRKADVDHLKEFISRTTDRIRVPYGRRGRSTGRFHMRNGKRSMTSNLLMIGLGRRRM